jgi:hypothetical protein
VRPALAAVGLEPQLVAVAVARRGGLSALALTVGDGDGFASFAELRVAVGGSSLAPDAVTDVVAVAERLAAAERAVHGDDEPHLHELAGVDTAVDLIAVAALVRDLAPTRVVASPPALGGGRVTTAHGELPVPAPAVFELLRGLPTAGAGTDDDGELTTPTGAALLAHFVDEFAPLPAGRIVADGCGAGAREVVGRANVLRAVLLEVAGVGEEAVGEADGGEPVGAVPEAAPASVELLETNLDDLTPEVLAHAADELRSIGALDVWFTNAVMKKGRPGVVLHALVQAADRGPAAECIFRETSTFGIRVTPVERIYLEERWESVAVAGHDIRVRLGVLGGRLVTATPEYEDCAAAATHADLPLREIQETAQSFVRRQYADAGEPTASG